jgi:hypothetical protein
MAASYIVMLQNIIQRIIFSFFKITVAILRHPLSFKTSRILMTSATPSDYEAKRIAL